LRTERTNSGKQDHAPTQGTESVLPSLEWIPDHTTRGAAPQRMQDPATEGCRRMEDPVDGSVGSGVVLEGNARSSMLVLLEFLEERNGRIAGCSPYVSNRTGRWDLQCRSFPSFIFHALLRKFQHKVFWISNIYFYFITDIL
jgi:hypothetical protein